jgi:hypothetical protein
MPDTTNVVTGILLVIIFVGVVLLAIVKGRNK